MFKIKPLYTIFRVHQISLSANCRCHNLVYENTLNYLEKSAIKDEFKDHSYQDLHSRSEFVQKQIQLHQGKKNQNTIAIFCPNNFSFVVSLWAIWKAGHIAVPLSHKHPGMLLKYFIEDSKASCILTSTVLLPKLNAFYQNSKDVIVVDDISSTNNAIPEKYTDGADINDTSIVKNNNAMILYTSGTTGTPKGVLLSHSNIQSSITAMQTSWQWRSCDHILHCLPLYHSHGIVNALLTPLAVGAKVTMLPEFDAKLVWENLLNTSNFHNPAVNMFMAVPTIYVKLIEHYKKVNKTYSTKEYVKKYCKENIRLMVSGSASLPVSVLEEWQQMTSHTLLERYGMTEIGMALTNPLKGQRKPGFVGQPFPNVKVQIVQYSSDRSSYTVLSEGDSSCTKTYTKEPVVGELLIKGPNVFKEYWKRSLETQKEFAPNGWFITGDSCEYVEGTYRILGRTSVDIIKSGGFKISTLEVERHLLLHPSVKEVAVVPLKDNTWGQKVCAIVHWDSTFNFDPITFRTWAKSVLPSYQVPAIVVPTYEPLKKNLMGKINKKELIKEFCTDL